MGVRVFACGSICCIGITVVVDTVANIILTWGAIGVIVIAVIQIIADIMLTLWNWFRVIPIGFGIANGVGQGIANVIMTVACWALTAAEIGGFPFWIFGGVIIAIFVDVAGDIGVPVDFPIFAIFNQELCFAAVGSFFVTIPPTNFAGKPAGVLIGIVICEKRGFIELLATVVEDTLASVMLSAGFGRTRRTTGCAVLGGANELGIIDVAEILGWHLTSWVWPS